MIEGDGVALYARVSSDGQARDNTIASQVAALREGVAADGFLLVPDHAYVDEGYSGTILLRPALERLRDAVAGGIVTRIYIHAPDRLARRYAHQVLLIEEFHRAGAEVIFLNRSIGGTAEDDLLLQVQGVIAEYERAKILERGRRGRRHAARSGSVSALTGAPFGYRYVRRDLGGGVARFEVLEEEVCIVRLIFAWVGLERTSIREVCRRLERMGCRTRQGATRWYASTICGMLNNPAYIGRAVFGRVHYGPARPRLRPIRGHPLPSSRPTERISAPREEWIEIPVPALVDPAVFEAVRAQLEENRKRKRDRKAGSGWLLQGLVVCRRCGYAYCGKAAPRSRKDPSKKLRYYQCSGSEGHRFGGSPPCSNQAVRADRLEEIVWSEVRALLEDPSRVEDEYRRRLTTGPVGRNLSRIIVSSVRATARPSRPVEDAGRQEGLCSAQTDPGTGVWHHQIGARIPSIFVARARQGARRVEPCDHGLEHQTDVCPHPRLTRPCAAWRRESRRLPRSNGGDHNAIWTPPNVRGSWRGKIVLGVLLQSLSPTGC